LKLAQALGVCPEEVEIIGIQPREISWGEELSPAVQASLPRVVEMVMKEISSAFIAPEAAERGQISLKSENCKMKNAN
jgi:Ni,Fe-hydrogenase maturation factor